MMNRQCLIEGCGKKYYAKGYCNMHYCRVLKGVLDMRPERLPSGSGWDKRPRKGICNIPDCNKPHYAKGFCQNHWALNIRNGKPERKASYGRNCCVSLCNEEATPMTKFCRFHLQRHRNGIPLEIPKGEAFFGERNPRWNGGNSQYPNHSGMKRVRKEILKEANNVCHFCGGYANQIHHNDLSKNNHAKEKLVACCHKCNHLSEHKTSKFKRLYGYTLKEIRQGRPFPDILKVEQRLLVGI